MIVKRIYLFTALFLCMSFVKAQSSLIFYVNEYHDFSMLIDSNATVERNFVADGYMDVFSFTKNNEDYKVLTISKFNIAGKKGFSKSDMLLEGEYMKDYQANCACKVLEVNKKEYTNISSIQYKIRKNVGDFIMEAYVDNFVVEDKLFVVFHMDTKEDLPKGKAEYDRIMNSLIVNHGKVLW